MNMSNINFYQQQVFIICLLLSLISISLNVKATESITVNAYTDHPPYLYYEDGQQTGLYMHIVALTLKAINQPYSVQTLPFKRGLYQTELGDGIMIGILKTDQRMQTLDFSEPFYQEKVSIYSNKKQTPLIKTLDELDGLSIGTLLGWSYGAKFDKAKAENRFFVKNGKLETNFFWLSKGKLDAMVHSELSAIYIINKLGLNDKVFLASEPLALANIHIAVKKGTQKKLLEKINQKLKEPKHIEKINIIISNYQK